MNKMVQSEKGAALPMVLIAIALGALVIPSFLNHTGTSLISSKAYVQEIHTQYAADSGAEHAIWNLKYGGLKIVIPDVGDSTSYSINETINNQQVNVTVIHTDDKPSDIYEIAASAGNKQVDTTIAIKGNNISILNWTYE